MPKHHNCWRSPRIAWVLAGLPLVYLVMVLIGVATTPNAVLRITADGLAIMCALSLPFWLVAFAWRLEPALEVRWLAAFVVVLGEVFIGLFYLGNWFQTTLPRDEARGFSWHFLFLLIGVILAQGAVAALCLFLASSAHHRRQVAARRKPQ